MISRVAKFKVFVGSFFIQASWSFKSMQGLGFAAAVSPALGEIYTDKDKRVEALKRHTVYYNAHPYMASPVLGAVINLEEQVSSHTADPRAVVAFKEALMGPYGSIGDGFFWGAIRPVAALVGILATLFIGFWGPLIFLLLYNIFHLGMRIKGLEMGLKYGEKIIKRVAGLKLPVWSIRLRFIGSALLGVISTLLVLSLFGGVAAASSSLRPLLFEVVLVLLVLGINIFLVERLALQRLIYAVTVPALIFGIIIL